MLNLLFPLALLAVLTVMIVISLGYEHTARLFPLLVMLPVAALLLLQILLEMGKLKHKAAPKEGDTSAGQASLASYLKSQVWVAMLLLSIYVLGFVAGPAFFLLIYFRLHGVKWMTTALCIGVVVAVVYGAFGLLFEVYLYKGLLFEYL